MADWPIGSGSRVEAAGANTGTSSGTLVTSGGSSHTKGSWTELIASTAFGSSQLLVMASGTDRIGLHDIGVGGAGSEQILIPDLATSPPASVAGGPVYVLVPVAVPAGSRIAARYQCSVASVGATMIAWPIATGFDGQSPRSSVRAYGVEVSGSTRGCQVDPGGTANTKGAWAQVTASTTAPIRQLFAMFTNAGATTASNATWLVDIGVGGAGSEQVLVPNFRLAATTFETFVPSVMPTVPVSIPQSSRLAVRAQCSITTNSIGGRLFDVVLYGIT